MTTKHNHEVTRLAEESYNTLARFTGGKAPGGADMLPAWGDLPPSQQLAWMCLVKDIADKVLANRHTELLEQVVKLQTEQQASAPAAASVDDVPSSYTDRCIDALTIEWLGRFKPDEIGSVDRIISVATNAVAAMNRRRAARQKK